MFFGFQLTCGLMLVFYGYSVMKNPRVWGDQGRQAVKAENFPEYCRQNGLFFLKAGFLMALIGALDALFTLERTAVPAAVRFWAGVCVLSAYPLVQGQRGLLLALAPRGKREKADREAARTTEITREQIKRKL